ncbi:MAG: hypothetical protein RML94_00025 [Bacteroidia bacterium]|nr:hypothetical protein [Bacteroidia bacterium]
MACNPFRSEHIVNVRINEGDTPTNFLAAVNRYLYLSYFMQKDEASKEAILDAMVNYAYEQQKSKQDIKNENVYRSAIRQVIKDFLDKSAKVNETLQAYEQAKANYSIDERLYMGLMLFAKTASVFDHYAFTDLNTAKSVIEEFLDTQKGEFENFARLFFTENEKATLYEIVNKNKAGIVDITANSLKLSERKEADNKMTIGKTVSDFYKLVESLRRHKGNSFIQKMSQKALSQAIVGLANNDIVAETLLSQQVKLYETYSETEIYDRFANNTLPPETALRSFYKMIETNIQDEQERVAFLQFVENQKNTDMGSSITHNTIIQNQTGLKTIGETPVVSVTLNTDVFERLAEKIIEVQKPIVEELRKATENMNLIAQTLLNVANSILTHRTTVVQGANPEQVASTLVQVATSVQQLQQTNVTPNDITIITEHAEKKLEEVEKQIFSEEQKEAIKKSKLSISNLRKAVTLLVVDSNEVTLSEDKKEYIYNGVGYQRISDVLKHWFDFDTNRALKAFFHSIEVGVGTAVSQAITGDPVTHKGTYTKNQILKDINYLRYPIDKNKKQETVNTIYSMFQTIANYKTEFENGFIKEYERAIEEKRGLNLYNVLNDTIVGAGNHKTALIEELKRTLNGKGEAYIDIFTNLLRLNLSSYDYYLKRVLLGVQSERLIKEYITDFFEKQKTGGQVGLPALHKNVSKEQAVALLSGLSVSNAHFYISDLAEEYWEERVKNEPADIDIQDYLSFLKEKARTLKEAIDEYNSPTPVLPKDNGWIENYPAFFDPNPDIDSETFGWASEMSKKLDAINTYIEHFKVEDFNQQLKTAGDIIIAKTQEVLSDASVLTINDTPVSDWEQVLFFDKKILGKIYDGKQTLYNISGSPDFMLRYKKKEGEKEPKTYTHIYELKAYYNKDEERQVDPSEITAKRMGYTVQDKAMFQLSGYMTILNGAIGVNREVNSGELIVVGSNKIENNKISPRQVKSYSLFQNKILSRGMKNAQRIDPEVLPIIQNQGKMTVYFTPALFEPVVETVVDKDNNVKEIQKPALYTQFINSLYDGFIDWNDKIVIKTDNIINETIVTGTKHQGYGVYYKQDGKETLVGIVPKSNVTDSVIQDYNQVAFSFVEALQHSMPILKLAKKRDATSVIEENTYLKLGDFVKTLTDSLSKTLNIPEKNIYFMADDELPPQATREKRLYLKYIFEKNMIIGRYGGQLIFSQRVYKPRLEKGNEEHKKIVDNIKFLISKLVKKDPETGATILDEQEIKKISSDENLRNAYNEFKAFIVGNLDFLRKNPDIKKKISLSFSKRGQEHGDYRMYILDPTILEDVLERLNPKEKKKGEILDFYSYASWGKWIKEGDKKKFVMNLDDSYVRVAEFVTDKNNPTELSIIPNNMAIDFETEKKKQIINEIRDIQHKRYIYNKANQILSNFVRGNKAVAIHRKYIGVVEETELQAPVFTASLLEGIRKNFYLPDENTEALTQNIVAIHFMLESMLYEMRFGFSQESDFSRDPYAVKNYEDIFKDIVSSVISSIDVWKANQVLKDAQEQEILEKTSDILKYIVLEISKYRDAEIKQKELEKTEGEVIDVATQEEEVDEEVLTERETNEDNSFNKELREEAGTYQSIILGASKMTLEKNVNAVIKKIVQYTKTKEAYIIGGKVIELPKNQQNRYVNFNVLYNALPNVLSEYWFRHNKLQASVNSPQEIAEVIKSKIITLLESKNGESNLDIDFFVDIIAFYDKFFNEENPNSLIVRAKENKELEALLNGMFNAFGSFTKTNYYVTNGETGDISLRNAFSNSTYITNSLVSIKKSFSQHSTAPVDFIKTNFVSSEAKEANPSLHQNKEIMDGFAHVHAYFSKMGIANGNKKIIKMLYIAALKTFRRIGEIGYTEEEEPKRLYDAIKKNNFNDAQTALAIMFSSIQEVESLFRANLDDISLMMGSSMFRTLDGENRSDMGLKSTTIEDLGTLVQIHKLNKMQEIDADAKEEFLQTEKGREILALQNSPFYKHNLFVQYGSPGYGDYLGVAFKRKDMSNIEYAKMDEEDIVFRNFYSNIYQGMSKGDIQIASFISSNKKISFQASVPYTPFVQKIVKAGINENIIVDAFVEEALLRLDMEFKAALKTGKAVKTGEGKYTFEFLSYLDEHNKRYSISVKTKEGAIAETEDELKKKIREQFLNKTQAYTSLVRRVNSGKYKNEKEGIDYLKMISDSAATMKAITAIYTIFKWDLDTYLYGYANLEYKGLDKANKRASIHTSVKYKVNEDAAYGVGKHIPVAMLQTPEKAMSLLSILGYTDDINNTKYKPYDGAAWVNPVFSEIFARATGKDLGFALTQEGSHKPVAMWRDRINLTNTSLKFASFDVLLKNIDNYTFFDIKKMLSIMLGKGIIFNPTFYQKLSKEEEEHLFKITEGVIPYNDETLKGIPFSKLDISAIADFYQVNNVIREHYKSERKGEPKNPYHPTDKRHLLFTNTVSKHRNDIKKYDTAIDEMIAIVADREAFKNNTPAAIRFYDNDGKVLDVSAISVPENTGIIPYQTKYYGFQLNPHHEITGTEKTPLATQLLYLVSVYSEKTNSEQNKELAQDIYNQLSQYISSIEIEKLFPYIKRNEKGETEIDYQEFFKKVFEKSKADPSDVAMFMDMVNRGVSPFVNPKFADKLIYHIASTVEKNVVRLKTRGTDFVLVPDFNINKKSYTIDKKGNLHFKEGKLEWHNVIFETKKDIQLGNTKYKKGTLINYNEIKNSVSQEETIKLQKLINNEDVSIYKIEECELACTVPDKRTLSKFLEAKDLLNKQIIQFNLSKERSNKERISVLPDFSVYGDNPVGIDNPYEYVEMVKAKIEEAKNAGVDFSEKDLDIINTATDNFYRMVTPLGVRIPTTSKGNSVAGRIVKFLNTDSNVVVFSSDIVKIHGSDYDIDKIKLFFKNYRQKTKGELNNLTEEQIREQKQYEITDKIIDTLKTILLDANNVYELFTDIDFDNAKKNISIYERALNQELVARNIPYGTIEADIKLQTENMTNTFLVGLFATTAKAFAHMAAANVTVEYKGKEHNFNLDVAERDAYTYDVSDEGTLIKKKTDTTASYIKYAFPINALSIATNAAIDAVKEQIHGAINNNLRNSRGYAYLLFQRNAFVASALFLNPYSVLNEKFHKAKSKKIALKTLMQWGLEEKDIPNFDLVSTYKTRSVVSDESLYDLLRLSPSTTLIENIFSTIQNVISITNSTATINSVFNKALAALKDKENFSNELLAALNKLKLDKEQKKRKKAEKEAGTAKSESEIKEESAVKEKKSDKEKTEKLGFDENEYKKASEVLYNYLSQFNEMLDKEIVIKLEDMDGSVSQEHVVTVRQALAWANNEYNTIVDIGKDSGRISSVFSVNQGYEKDYEENLIRTSKTLNLLKNGKSKFFSIGKLFNNENAGYYIEYYTALNKAYKLVGGKTIYTNNLYNRLIDQYQRTKEYEVGVDYARKFREGFFKVVKAATVTANQKLTIKDKTYNIDTETGAASFVDDFFSTIIKNMNINNMFLYPLRVISIGNYSMKLYADNNSFAIEAGVRSIVYFIYDKLRAHFEKYGTGAEAFTEQAIQEFFNDPEIRDSVYLTKIKEYFPAPVEDADAEANEQKLKTWQQNTFAQLTAQYHEATEYYHAFFTYESLTSPLKKNKGVIDAVPNSIKMGILNLENEVQKSFDNKKDDADFETVIGREVFSNLPIREKEEQISMDIYSEDNNMVVEPFEVIKGEQETLEITIHTKPKNEDKPNPYYIIRKVSDEYEEALNPDYEPKITHFVKLSNKEIERLNEIYKKNNQTDENYFDEEKDVYIAVVPANKEIKFNKPFVPEIQVVNNQTGDSVPLFTPFRGYKTVEQGKIKYVVYNKENENVFFRGRIRAAKGLENNAHNNSLGEEKIEAKMRSVIQEMGFSYAFESIIKDISHPSKNLFAHNTVCS